MIAGVVALAVLVLLALAVVAADGSVARLAERKASEYLSAPLGRAARVQVHGRPFLTQAVRGRYGEVEVTADGLQLGVLGSVRMRAHLRNAYLPLRDLLGRRADELPVEAVHGHVVVPYQELVRVSRIAGLRLAYRDDRMVASAQLPVPGISQLARVSGEAVATIGEAGGVWLRVRNVSVAGIALPSLVLNQLLPALAFPVPLPQLPYGLRLEQLTPTPDGLQVSGAARAVVFRKSSPQVVHPAG